MMVHFISDDDPSTGACGRPMLAGPPARGALPESFTPAPTRVTCRYCLEAMSAQDLLRGGAPPTVEFLSAPECALCGKTPPGARTVWHYTGRRHGLVCSERCVELARAFDLVDSCAQQARRLAWRITEGHGMIKSAQEWEEEREDLADELRELNTLVERMTPDVVPDPRRDA